MTMNPDKSKTGVNISQVKYEIMKENILDAFKARQELSYSGLVNMINNWLADSFEGSIRWYVEVVKLDLEARKIIEKIPNTKPQMYRLSGK
ncbi:MAG: hypothetical protein GY839_18245 [candidate division Zixibacteria bacterium]|nr:hypothetical protein [candidate division Zixibacteria bacterium]